jgi:hypothetical protein
MSAAAGALEMTPGQLRTQLRGQSLTALAQQVNKDPVAVKEAILGTLHAQVDQAAANGRLTPERAQQRKDAISAGIDTLMTRVFPAGAQPAPAQAPRGGPGR